jgi:hypothetical protein
MKKPIKEEEKQDNKEKAPRYITKKPDFFCPLSPSIMWHHGMYYKECPLNASNRDMSQCGNCKLRWQGIDRTQKKDKTNQVVERQIKEEIPNIGKTYTSE